MTTRAFLAAATLVIASVEGYPYECHEGNNALRNMLSAARAEEKVIGEILPADPSFGRRK